VPYANRGERRARGAAGYRALIAKVSLRHARRHALIRIAATDLADHKRSAILAAIFPAASALTPLARRSMFTMTSPLRIMNPEPPGAR
jgi:hypothetical protein